MYTLSMHIAGVHRLIIQISMHSLCMRIAVVQSDMSLACLIKATPINHTNVGSTVKYRLYTVQLEYLQH